MKKWNQLFRMFIKRALDAVDEKVKKSNSIKVGIVTGTIKQDVEK